MAKLDVATLLSELGTAGVRYVLTGSVAAAAYGIALEPRDLDIAPDPESENLSRLAGLLRRWAAKPVFLPDWPGGLSREACERWTPDPPTTENLDHLLTTPHGLFDVVPERSGAYGELAPRARTLAHEGRTILVAHPADLVATLRLHKAKHQDRQRPLMVICERLERGEAIAPRLPERWR